VIHDGMQYDPIQVQGQDNKPFKFGNPAIFKTYLLRHLQWELATDHGFLHQGTIFKFDRAGFLIFGLILCHVTLKLAETSVLKSRPPARLIYFCNCICIVCMIYVCVIYAFVSSF